MANSVWTKKSNNLPRLPLKGEIDITYRCNNDCRHCWLRIPPDAQEKSDELNFKEIRSVVDEARSMGCRQWSLSGGEPMLRPDFSEIFDYLTRNSNRYSLNTNGTFITPKIARLMKREGVKMVALYGATARVHDYISRRPGSFESAIRGISYLKEVGAGFTVQLVPMRDNYHQFKAMVKLATSLSPSYRIGASWFYLSACGNLEKNKSILNQRLEPKETVSVNKPNLSYEAWLENETKHRCQQHLEKRDNLFSACIASRRVFHIDPYGQMTFCCFIKEPGMRYDLKRGNFQEGWEEFIPSLADKIRADKEYRENCGSCRLRKDCGWCPVFGFLEHRRFGAKVNYLCAVTKERQKFKAKWPKRHRRYYQIAGITLQVESELPFSGLTLHPKFKLFRVTNPGKDLVSLEHYFTLPELNRKDLGKELYRTPPWAIYQKGDFWIYLGIPFRSAVKKLSRIAVFSRDYSRAVIYNNSKKIFLKGNLKTLSFFPNDQVFLTQLLADRNGFVLHSSGVRLNGQGLLFVGHSGAGKSTIAKLLRGKAEVLCDERIIIRKPAEKFFIYGTWNHGIVKDVSAVPAPLKAIFFLAKAKEDSIIALSDKKEITRRLLPLIIRPFITAHWWEKTIRILDDVINATPFYELKFRKSAEIANLLIQEPWSEARINNGK